MRQTYYHGKTQYSKRLDEKLAALLKEEEDEKARESRPVAATGHVKEESALPPVMIYTSLESATADMQKANRVKAMERVASAAEREGKERRTAINLAKTSTWSSVKMWQTYEESRIAAKVQRDAWSTYNQQVSKQRSECRKDWGALSVSHAPAGAVLPVRPSTVPVPHGASPASSGASWGAQLLATQPRPCSAIPDGDSSSNNLISAAPDAPNAAASPPIIPHLRCHTPDPKKDQRTHFADHPFAPAAKEKYNELYAHHVTSPLRQRKEPEDTPPPVPKPYMWVDAWMSKDKDPSGLCDPPVGAWRAAASANAKRGGAVPPPEEQPRIESSTPPMGTPTTGTAMTPLLGTLDWSVTARPPSPSPSLSPSPLRGGGESPGASTATSATGPRYLRETATRRPTLIHQMVPLPQKTQTRMHGGNEAALNDSTRRTLQMLQARKETGRPQRALRKEVTAVGDTLHGVGLHEDGSRTSMHFKEEASRVRVALGRERERIERGMDDTVDIRMSEAEQHSLRAVFASKEREIRAQIIQEEVLARVDILYGAPTGAPAGKGRKDSFNVGAFEQSVLGFSGFGTVFNFSGRGLANFGESFAAFGFGESPDRKPSVSMGCGRSSITPLGATGLMLQIDGSTSPRR
eukprot:TRINITY_DN22341_c0_g1_i1.p2 TRINITY_DN22341_c0_g1~~TRINITY_DN22341_c0_g1_i1.p2  ORF type:complete len:635 (+),score=220.64 TRINITY_DN22341_c0_g1_i1:155-2059(+)